MNLIIKETATEITTIDGRVWNLTRTGKWTDGNDNYAEIFIGRQAVRYLVQL